MSIRIKIRNARAVRRALDDLAGQGKAAAKATLLDWSKGTQKDAREFAPKDTGALERSITARTNAGTLTASVRTNLHYAQFVEFGTSSMKAQPFMYPAVGPNNRKVKGWLTAHIREELGL